MKAWTPPVSIDFTFNERSYSPANSSPVRNSYATYSVIDQQQIFNTTRLKPAKGLYQTRHPNILEPQAISQHPYTPTIPRNPLATMNEYHEAQIHPAVLTPGPRRAISEYGDDLTHQELKPLYTLTPRPLSSYLPYRPPEAKSRETLRKHTITSVDLCESPGTYSENDYDMWGNSNNATYLHTPTPPALSPRRSEHLTQGYSASSTDIRRSSHIRHRRLKSQATINFDSTKLDLASLNTSTPISNPISTKPSLTPAPIASPTVPPSFRSARSSSSSLASSRSTSYGAWNPSPIRPKQASFIERTRARLERKLSIVGWRSSPTFKVHAVWKAHSTSSRVWDATGSEKDPSPVTSPSMESETEIGTSSGWNTGDSEVTTTAPSPTPLRRVKPLHIDTSSAHRANRPLYRQPSKDSLPPSEGKSGIQDRKHIQRQSSEGIWVSEETIWARIHAHRQIAAFKEEVGESAVQRDGTTRWDERVEPRKTQSSLELTSLQSPSKDTGRPLPFDDRCNLPSQTQQPAANRHTLSRKRGVKLR
ncbi:hypothetical protein F4859DRAFT_515888 [Xylaria cf. heliscus]|nr:hypothetical protein F4859DRAFT_515888 [Xylaria cf. heliscus]